MGFFSMVSLTQLICQANNYKYAFLLYICFSSFLMIVYALPLLLIGRKDVIPSLDLSEEQEKNTI